MNHGISLGHVVIQQRLAFIRRLGVAKLHIRAGMAVTDCRHVQHVSVGLQPQPFEMGHQSRSQNNGTCRTSDEWLTYWHA